MSCYRIQPTNRRARIAIGLVLYLAALLVTVSCSCEGVSKSDECVRQYMLDYKVSAFVYSRPNSRDDGPVMPSLSKISCFS